MDFITALASVRSGERVTREGWNNEQVYVCLNAGVLSLKKEDGQFYSWIISEVDMFAHDWRTVADA